jgi:hypothetical protein
MVTLGAACDSAHMVGAVLGSGGRSGDDGGAPADGGAGGVAGDSGGSGLPGSGGSRGSGGAGAGGGGGSGAMGPGGSNGSGGRGAGSGGRQGTGGATAGTGGAGSGGALAGSGGSGGGAGGRGGASGGAGGSPAGSAQTCTIPDVPSVCPAGLRCICYQTGPIQTACYCTTTCTGPGDCSDPARPSCGGCAEPSLECLPADAPGPCCGCDCAAPDTPVATPGGDRAIVSLRPGDLVMSLDGGQLVAVPILRTGRVRQIDHHVVEVVLDSGARLEISEGHPTADGRTFADLAPGERLGGARIVSLRTIPYRHGYTHDILPASDSGTYLAGGALIGSTLARR